jgi:hypothetical protein
LGAGPAFCTTVGAVGAAGAVGAFGATGAAFGATEELASAPHSSSSLLLLFFSRKLAVEVVATGCGASTLGATGATVGAAVVVGAVIVVGAATAVAAGKQMTKNEKQ